MINPDREYTCGGYPVIDIRIVPTNGAGQTVTYPVKGTVVRRHPSGRAWYVYGIWSADGIADVVWGRGENLVPVA